MFDFLSDFFSEDPIKKVFALLGIGGIGLIGSFSLIEVESFNINIGGDRQPASTIVESSDASTSPSDLIAPIISTNPANLPDLALFRECETCPDMVVLPGNSFRMGSPSGETGRSQNEGQTRQVRLGRFAVSRFEITWDQWEACVAARVCRSGPVEAAGGDNGWGRGNMPVIEVSWFDAQDFVRFLSNETGANYRLLSESEWEYAARARSRAPYPWGHDKDLGCSHANGADASAKRQSSAWETANCDDGFAFVAPIGSFSPNRFGLFDTHGNVSEWVEDWYHSGYSRSPSNGTALVNCGTCSSRVIRGGSWDDTPLNLRSASRNFSEPDLRFNDVGIRVARTLSR